MTSGKVILVVDDDDSMREAIERLLNTAGFETGTFSSAEALLAQNGIDSALCIISDLRLPAMSGFELISELRSHPAAPPVILVTAHDEPGVRDEALRRGAAGYLSKPFSGHALLAAIETTHQTR